jgi:predicted GTPase
LSDVQKDLVAALNRAASQLRAAGLPGELATRIEELAGQVHSPCVVAVVGRVRVGKSTFVNALLGEDHAKIGTTETTATINYFSYGEPGRLLAPDRPFPAGPLQPSSLGCSI